MLDDLAYSSDPYPAYAGMRERGVHRVDDGRWVVSRAADVIAVLSHPAAHVECRRAGDARLDDVRAAMARFSNGVDHARRRAIAAQALADTAVRDVRGRASTIARDMLVGARADVVALARGVVPLVVAEILGFADPMATTSAINVVASALAPRSDRPAPSTEAVDVSLTALLAAAPTAPDEEARINVVALLHQSLDAAAGLVASAVLAAAKHDCRNIDVAALVREANRWDPPVQHTTRIAAADLGVGDLVIESGERIVVVFAAANRDPDAVDAPDEFRPDRIERGLGFGSGVHACPGESIALELASGIVDAVLSAGLRPIRTDVRYERRPNLRIPADLILAGSRRAAACRSDAGP